MYSIYEEMNNHEEINNQENWGWVDKRLEEIYHNYGVTEENYDDYIDAGLLNERWDWIDDELQRRDDEIQRWFENEEPLRPAPLNWVFYKDKPKQYSLEEMPNRLECQSPLAIDIYLADYYFANDVTSEYLEFSQCSPISLSGSRCSELTKTIDDIDDAYDAYDDAYDSDADAYDAYDADAYDSF